MLGGSATAKTNATLAVRAGVINEQNAEALRDVALTFASNTALTLAVSADRSDERWTYGLLANGGLTAEGESLDVRFAFEAMPKSSFTIPLCTVPVSDAEALAAKVSLPERVSGYAVTIQTEPVQWNGTSYTRLLAQFKDISGTIIVIR